jgi:hypothetical protein
LLAGMLTLVILLSLLPLNSVVAEQADTDQDAKKETRFAVEAVKLPGITIDAEKKRVDIDARVCLDEGLLEVIACIPDTKEHESLVMIDSVPMHVHVAMLLLGAKNGNPAMVTPANKEQAEWIHHPPRGDSISVSLILVNAKGDSIERPVSDFIRRRKGRNGFDEDKTEPIQEEQEADQPAKVFKTFLFTGSRTIEAGNDTRQYVADESGNVVSISTFGDEVLGLPSHVSHANDALVWEINPKHLPDKGTKVKLRLSLQDKPEHEESNQRED